MANRTSRTEKKTDAFLAALASGSSITKACEISGIARRCAYDWRAADHEFAAAWEAAVESGTDALEDEAIRRAKDGTLKPVFYRGSQCGDIREFSDTLMIFMLKARRPEKFRDTPPPARADGQKIVITGGLPDDD